MSRCGREGKLIVARYEKSLIHQQRQFQGEPLVRYELRSSN
jgi:hypothetical protein